MHKADKIKKLLEELEKEMRDMNIPDDVLERKIKKFTTSSHVILPGRYKGRTAIVIIKKGG